MDILEAIIKVLITILRRTIAVAYSNYFLRYKNAFANSCFDFESILPVIAIRNFGHNLIFGSLRFSVDRDIFLRCLSTMF